MATVVVELLKDFLSAIVFVLANAITHDVIIATTVAIAIALIQLGLSVARRQPISAMQRLSLVLVITLGGASLITADSRYICFKPTLVHFAIALVMLKRGWQSRYMPQIAQVWITKREVVAWGYVWAVAMFLMGIINGIAAQWLDVAGWGLVLSGMLVAKLVLIAVQYASMRLLISRRTAKAAPGMSGGEPIDS